MADLLHYAPTAQYDVVLLDRVLHQFPTPAARAQVFAVASNATKSGGILVIADTRSNRAEIDGLFAGDGNKAWSIRAVTKDLRLAIRSA